MLVEINPVPHKVCAASESPRPAWVRVCRFIIDVACKIVPHSMTLLSPGTSYANRHSDHPHARRTKKPTAMPAASCRFHHLLPRAEVTRLQAQAHRRSIRVVMILYATKNMMST